MIDLSIRKNLAQLRDLGPVLVFVAFTVSGAMLSVGYFPSSWWKGPLLVSLALCIPMTVCVLLVHRWKTAQTAPARFQIAGRPTQRRRRG
jgi:L-lactate permease